MTAAHRDTWAEVRESIYADNAASFEDIERALLVMSLDDATPSSLDEAGKLICAGQYDTSMNRWYDKLLGFVVFKNGFAGLSGEHAPMDAPVPGKLVDHAVKRIDSLGTSSPNISAASAAAFSPIEWRVEESTQALVNAAVFDTGLMLSNIKLRILHYKRYGANTIKSFKISPDTFAQMAMQLAYYKLTLHSSATYESASTRLFLHGRTETVKTLSEASQKWTHAMVSGDVGREEKRRLLLDAAKRHGWFMKRAMNGLGVDRHLLGLKMVMKEGERADIFEDPAYAQNRRYRISTSNMTSEYFFAGFGPTENDGYGFCYGTRKESLWFNITSHYNCESTCAEKMRASLASALDEMEALFAPDASL
eukprot:TRINITY_DN3790_c0_g1_i3.p1 TRINITY_DN3790_c0_g1~~TRINITY_DN3790_c0_g1_i3.p1  ORF type:complete len:365 (+),score=105.60 TRINITY_DN3790_c0_g1_i3:1027-2121(+)